MSPPVNQFLFDLGNLHDAGLRIAMTLPRTPLPSNSEDPKLAFPSHSENTGCHVTKVEQIFDCFGHEAGGKTRDATVKADPQGVENTVESGNSGADGITLKIAELLGDSHAG